MSIHINCFAKQTAYRGKIIFSSHLSVKIHFTIGLLIDLWVGTRASVLLHTNVNKCAIQIQLSNCENDKI